MPSFSLLAVAAVGLLTISGLYLARLHLHSVDQLLVTPYGRILPAKLGLVALMVGFGGYHQGIVQRHMLASLTPSAGGTDLVSPRFRKTLRIEAVLGILTLLLAAVLGTTSPPSTPSSPVTEAFHRVQDVGDALVTIEVSPLRPGPNAGHVTFAVKPTLRQQS